MTVRNQIATAVLLLWSGAAMAQSQPGAAPTNSLAAPSVAAASPAATEAASADDPKVKAAFASMMDACGADLRLYCSGIPFGDKEFGLCIRENYIRFSFTCQRRLQHMPRQLPGLNMYDPGMTSMPAQSKIR